MHGTMHWQSEWSHNWSKNIFLRQGCDLNIIMFSKLLYMDQELHVHVCYRGETARTGESSAGSAPFDLVYTIQEFVHVFGGL